MIRYYIYQIEQFNQLLFPEVALLQQVEMPLNLSTLLY